jgi:hypothetical protein
MIPRALASIIPLAVASGATACWGESPPRAAVLVLSRTPASQLVASPDGERVAWLGPCQRSAAAPTVEERCDLHVSSTSRAEPVLLTRAAGRAGDAAQWAATGRFLAFTANEPSPQTLFIAPPAGPPIAVSRGVTRFRAGCDVVAFVEGGSLRVAGPRGEILRDGIGKAAWYSTLPCTASHDAVLAAIRDGAAPRELVLVHRDGRETVLAANVGWAVISPRGEEIAYTTPVSGSAGLFLRSLEKGARARAVGRGVAATKFDPSGSSLAFLAGSGSAPGSADLWLVSGGTPVRLSRSASTFRWSETGSVLAWLQDVQTDFRVSSLSIAGPARAVRFIAPGVADFALSRDGRAVAYLVGRGPMASLWVMWDADGWARDRVDSAVPGFGFSPDGAELYYHSECFPGRRTYCTLLRIRREPDGGEVGPENVAGAAVWRYFFDVNHPDRVFVEQLRGPWLAYAGLFAQVCDREVSIAEDVTPSTAVVLGSTGRIVFTVGGASPGVRVATLPETGSTRPTDSWRRPRRRSRPRHWPRGARRRPG